MFATTSCIALGKKPSMILSIGISTSGMNAGLCELTWALRTMDGRFLMLRPRREAKVAPICPFSEFGSKVQFFILVSSGQKCRKGPAVPSMYSQHDGIETKISFISILS